MSSTFRKKIATILLLVYVPVMFTLGLQHHDGPLYTLPVSLSQTNNHATPITSVDGFCMACHFASRHFFDQPFHIFSSVENVTFMSVFNLYEHAQTHIFYTRKRAPPFV